MTEARRRTDANLLCFDHDGTCIDREQTAALPFAETAGIAIEDEHAVGIVEPSVALLRIGKIDSFRGGDCSLGIDFRK